MAKYQHYEIAKKQLLNKDEYIKNYVNYMLTKTNEIFIYENLPQEIDIKRLEYFLQKNGFVFFTKDSNYHFYNGSLFDFDIYEKPLKINAILENRSVKTFDLEKDGVLIANDFLYQGLEKIFNKYGVMLNECEITLYLSSIMNRIQYIINANDDKTKKNADIFIDKIYNGEFSIIGSNAFFDGVEVKGLSNNQNHTQQNIELTQYIRSMAFNEIGLNSNFNMKRERLNTTELTLNEKTLKPFIESMYQSRLQAVEKINQMYGLNITVTMSNLWDSFGGDSGTNEDAETDVQSENNATDNKETTETATENTEETTKTNEEEK